MTPQLTGNGRNILVKALAGETTLNFTSIHFGAGEEQDVGEATSLTDERMIVGITGIEKDTMFVTLKCNLDNQEVQEGFRVQEVGFYVTDPDNAENEILYAIGFESAENADYIPAVTTRAFEMHFDAIMYIGDIKDITATLSRSSIYITQEQFEAHLADFSNHTEDFDNPHRVTKSQVGLGNVPNVTTNNQQPTFSDSTTLTNINSGETLSTILGKIRTVIGRFISHVNSTGNPHNITPEQIGLGNVENISVNNMSPTFTEATNLESINSGESLRVMFGKIKHLFTRYMNRVVVYTMTPVNIEYWKEEATEDFPPYYADIPLEKVTPNHVPYVFFNITDSISGIFAGCCESKNGAVRIWANEIPDKVIIISNIMCVLEN